MQNKHVGIIGGKPDSGVRLTFKAVDVSRHVCSLSITSIHHKTHLSSHTRFSCGAHQHAFVLGVGVDLGLAGPFAQHPVLTKGVEFLPLLAQIDIVNQVG